MGNVNGVGEGRMECFYFLKMNGGGFYGGRFRVGKKKKKEGEKKKGRKNIYKKVGIMGIGEERRPK